jgi:hypothetical protein
MFQLVMPDTLFPMQDIYPSDCLGVVDPAEMTWVVLKSWRLKVTFNTTSRGTPFLLA